MSPRVSVVVPVYNRLLLTQRFLASFKNVQFQNYELVIVDDGSTDETSDWLTANRKDIHLLQGTGDLWWTGATNLGVRYALQHNFDFVLTINNDALVSPEFLTRLLESMQQKPRAIIGCCLFDSQEPQSIWSLGGTVSWYQGRPFGIRKPNSVGESRLVSADVLPGCGVLIPCQCFREIGLYNERWYPHYHSDSEFILRAAKAGFEILVDTQAKVWYDTEHSFKSRSLWSSLFGKRSPAYWKPVIAIHWSYCPWYLIVPSILRFYLCQNRFLSWWQRRSAK